MREKVTPTVGQVWRDRDKRTSNRHVRIEDFIDGRAVCRRVHRADDGGWVDAGRLGPTTVTRVSLKNFGPRWEFVS